MAQKLTLETFSLMASLWTSPIHCTCCYTNLVCTVFTVVERLAGLMRALWHLSQSALSVAPTPTKAPWCMIFYRPNSGVDARHYRWCDGLLHRCGAVVVGPQPLLCVCARCRQEGWTKWHLDWCCYPRMVGTWRVELLRVWAQALSLACLCQAH